MRLAAPIWITETADAACGGNPWGSTFLDTFRYVDQMGRLAKRGVQAIFHNTLASSEYGLIDQSDFRPRSNYWAALLWRRLMGTVVLDAGSPREGLHLYAQCLRGRPGGLALAGNQEQPHGPQGDYAASASVRYTLSAPNLQSASVMLNGQPLKLDPNDDLPEINGRAAAAGPIQFRPRHGHFSGHSRGRQYRMRGHQRLEPMSLITDPHRFALHFWRFI